MSRTDDDTPITVAMNLAIFVVAVGSGWAVAEAMLRARDRGLSNRG